MIMTVTKSGNSLEVRKQNISIYNDTIYIYVYTI
jgi:hypothetical protein